MDFRIDQTSATSINQTQIIPNEEGTFCLQLKGTHTTSTETEDQNLQQKKNVKFEDEAKDLKQKEDPKSQKEEYEDTEHLDLEVVYQGNFEYEERNANLETPATSKNQIETLFLKKQLQQTDTENIEISKSFKQVIDILDSFTKKTQMATEPQNPGEIHAEKRKIELAKSEYTGRHTDPEDLYKHRSSYKAFYNRAEASFPRRGASSFSSEELEVRQRFEEYLKQKELELKIPSNKVSKQTETQTRRNVSTTTSVCEMKSLGCQTFTSDHFSLNDLGLMEVSSLTSRSEQPNFLNNYAQPENACVSHHINSQPDLAKKPIVKAITQQPLTMPTSGPEITTTPSFNVITIEANASPSVILLRRAPLCQRFWNMVGDFCAATILCLQVNRDCIICLGFFAAFVVSASFLTAFFYHTLTTSPSIWEVTDNVRPA